MLVGAVVLEFAEPSDPIFRTCTFLKIRLELLIRALSTTPSDGLVHCLRRHDRAHLSNYLIGVATHA
jgi:hypothetical protein